VRGHCNRIYGAIKKNIGKKHVGRIPNKDSKYRKEKEVWGGPLNYGKIIL
jgi:hypothetical protein